MKKHEFMSKYATPLALLLVVFLIQLFNLDKNLLSASNIKIILLQSTVLGLTSLGLSIVMIGGETDLSIQGTIGMIGCTFALLLSMGKPPLLAFLVSLLAGVLTGVFIAYFVSKLKFSAFVITISFMFITMGIERTYNDGKTIWVTNENIKSLGTKEIFGLPILIVLLIVAYALWHFIINQTSYGFKLRVVGENSKAADEVGVNSSMYKASAFIFAAIIYTFAAVIEPIRVEGAIIYAGRNYLLPAMAACYFGSSMFTPGRVNILGTLIGSIFMSMIINFLSFLNIQYYFIPLIQGGLLLVGVGLATIKSREIKQVKI